MSKPIMVHTKAEVTSYPFGRYIENNIEEINKVIKGFQTIKKFKGKRINLLCQGSSGAIVATMFALQIPNSVILHIKKDGEDSHSSNGFPSDVFKDTINVIVDDFIATGSTVNRIYSKVKHNDITIHALCVSSNVREDRLDFSPDYIVCE